MRRFVLAAGILVALTACSGGGQPQPVPTASSTPVSQEKQAKIDGEWILTRIVVSSDDAANPARAAGAVSTRYVKFGDVACPVGACTGVVLSGVDQSVRESTTFSSAANVISYEFSGSINCLRADTGAVLFPNGYTYSARVELTVSATDAADPLKATALTGTLIYSDSVTNEALEAGCSREPVSTTTEYSLSAVRGALLPVTTPTPAP